MMELKPCPECGGKPILCEPNYADEGGTMVVCEACDYAGDSFKLGEFGEGREQAAEAWNTRADAAPDLLSALVDLERWFDTDPEILDAMDHDTRADHDRQLAKIRAAIRKARGQEVGV